MLRSIERAARRLERDENELQVKLISTFGLTCMVGVVIFYQFWIATAIPN